MEEKMIHKENENSNIPEKLSWEAPKLYSLDKAKTEGGLVIQTYEDTSLSMFS